MCERHRLLRGAGVFAVVAADLALKARAQQLLQLDFPLAVLPVLDLRLQYNWGIAFSLFDEAGSLWRWPLFTLGAAAAVFLAWWLYRLPAAGQRWTACGLVLLLGGALGNLFERLAHGRVTDFISVHWGGWYFPTFNLADMALTAGVVSVMIGSWAVHRKTSA